MAPLVDEPMADTRDMLMAHSALRREFRLLPDLVRSVAPGDSRRTRVVGAHAELMCRILRTHHKGEDRVLWPKLVERAGVDAEFIMPMMEQQHAVDVRYTEVVGLLAQWRSTGQGGEDLAHALERLLTALLRHLTLKEKEVLPLAAQYITAAEWRLVSQLGMRNTPRNDMPLIFGMAMYEGDPEVVKSVLATFPLPVQMIVPVVARRRYASYARQVHGTTWPPRVGA
ncbi:hemerythrin domain-containing protein [Actinacidiphila sp. bgisy167]|uniref:hemerythrin domain-containing protein n=1 Tax=Actinacidiphila sp. bgisy167 TaxID=3413797 RepID=UPI003D7076AE